MFTKSLIAVAAVVSSLIAVAPEPAKADVDWHIGVNLGHPGFYPGYGHGYEPVYPIYQPVRISCHQGRQTVKWSGFFNVRPFDCEGTSYRYTARKGGGLYRVTVSAHSGRITRVLPYAVY
jgi:hypothetical protein